MKEIEIPFGAKDSELKGWEYTIPEEMEAEIMDGKIIVREKKPELTEFEQGIRDMIVNALTTTHTISDGQVTSSVVMDYNTTHLLAAGLLELAKKEICKGCTVGLDSYIKGRDDERKEQEKSITYHYPMYELPCVLGGICADHIRDCINCSRTTGDISTYTASGTCKKEK